MRSKAASRNREWSVVPVGPDRWEDLAKLFGPRGSCATCWCLYWRLTHADFNALAADGRRRRMHRLVRTGATPGLLGYAGGEPVAWVSLGPRRDFAALQASRVFGPLDAQPVWSIVCFVVRRDQRGRGWMRRMLKAAIDYAWDHGATLVEGYPLEPGGRKLSGDSGYTGIASTFRAEGFWEVARPRPDRPVMRRRLRRRTRPARRTQEDRHG
jgi:GNAT superfamily N-acetyltransferase